MVEDYGGDSSRMGNGGSNCFIATAAYGSELAPPVQFLRDFRDQTVLKSKFKRAFEAMLSVYYRFSPPIADLMRRNRAFKHFMKYTIVWPFVALTLAASFVVKTLIEKKRG